MSDKYTFTLRDWETTCEMNFLILEYLEWYFKNIDITKVRVHDIINWKLYFTYWNRYESCEFMTREDYLKVYIPAISEVKAFIAIMLSNQYLLKIMQK